MKIEEREFSFFIWGNEIRIHIFSFLLLFTQTGNIKRLNMLYSLWNKPDMIYTIFIFSVIYSLWHLSLYTKCLTICFLSASFLSNTIYFMVWSKPNLKLKGRKNLCIDFIYHIWRCDINKSYNFLFKIRKDFSPQIKFRFV